MNSNYSWNLIPSCKAAFDDDVSFVILYKGFSINNGLIKLHHDVLKLTYGIVKM